MQKIYDVGTLKDNPEVLYDLATLFSYVCSYRELCADPDSEIWQVLQSVNNSLWSNLPPVVTIDFRNPDDPETWGDFGPPPSSV